MDTTPAEVSMMRLPSKPPFPPEIKAVFDALRHQIELLHAYWDAYRQLFGSTESVAALNEVAAGAFGLVRYAFCEEMVIAFSRLTDPKKTSGKENLTLEQLVDVVSQHCDNKAFLDQLAAAETDIAANCLPIRRLRNRTTAHLDLKTALKYHPDPLSEISGLM